jgi:hypothetical protein
MLKYWRGPVIGMTALAALVAGCSSGAKAADLTVTGSEYKFETSGKAAPGSTLITFKNGGKETHHLQLLHLAQGKTMADLGPVLQSGNLAAVPGTFEGGVGQIEKGGSGKLEATLTAGTYAMLCFVPAADGTPHFAKGMMGSFEVAGDTNTAAFEAPDLKVVAADYNFTAADTIKAGETTIELTNNGKEPHEANLFKLASGVTLQQALQALATEGAPPAGPPPFTPEGGAQGILPGQKTQIVIGLEKGEYAIVCFIPDATNTPHIAKGMVRSLKVE